LRLALRGLAEELLGSKRVVPAAPLDYGFGFRFPEIEAALHDLLG
jgi:NAD dependent epimerase/dehydratase family enzyme